MRKNRPLTPRSEPTICAVTRGNIAELAATAFIALLMVLLSVGTIRYKEEQRSGGEGVSQSPLKDKAFLTFRDQNPPFELPPKAGVSPPIFHEIHRGSSKFQLIISKVQMGMSRFEHDSHAGRNRTAFSSLADARAWEDSPRRYSQRYSRDFRSHGAMVRSQKREQGRVYSSMSPERRRDRRARAPTLTRL